MKKTIILLITIFLCIGICFSITGCSKKNAEVSVNQGQTPTTVDIPYGIGVETINGGNLIAARYLFPTSPYITETIDEKIYNKILEQVKQEIAQQFEEYKNVELKTEFVNVKQIEEENMSYYLIKGQLNGNHFLVLYSQSTQVNYITINVYIQTNGNKDILDTIVK